MRRKWGEGPASGANSGATEEPSLGETQKGLKMDANDTHILNLSRLWDETHLEEDPCEETQVLRLEVL